MGEIIPQRKETKKDGRTADQADVSSGAPQGTVN